MLEVLIDGRRTTPWPGPSVAVPARRWHSAARAVWGAERDVRVLVPSDDGDSTAIAAYVAKYATKTADGTRGWPTRSARPAQLERLELRPHIVRLVRTAWALGRRKELRSLRLRAHAHTLGYTGQFSSKSLRFSTTFGALRRARVAPRQGRVRRRRCGLRRGVALRRPGLRPPRVGSGGRIAPRGVREVPHRVPTHFHNQFHNAMTRENG